MLLRGWIIMGVSMDEVAIGRLKIYWEKKEKEEVLILRAIDLSMVAAGLTFLFRYTGNIRVFATFGDWKYGEKRRKGRGFYYASATSHRLSNSYFSFRGIGWGRKMGKKRTLREWILQGPEFSFFIWLLQVSSGKFIICNQQKMFCKIIKITRTLGFHSSTQSKTQ